MDWLEDGIGSVSYKGLQSELQRQCFSRDSGDGAEGMMAMAAMKGLLGVALDVEWAVKAKAALAVGIEDIELGGCGGGIVYLFIYLVKKQ